MEASPFAVAFIVYCITHSILPNCLSAVRLKRVQNRADNFEVVILVLDGYASHMKTAEDTKMGCQWQGVHCNTLAGIYV